MVLRWFSDLRLRGKLVLAYSSVFLVCLIGSTFVIYSQVRQTIEANIESELENTTATILDMVRASIDASIRNYLRAVAEKNRDVAQAFYDRALSGEMTMDQAKAQAEAVFLSQRIGLTGYIFCLDSSGVIVVHPEKSLKGADLTEYPFVQDQLRLHEGYLEYDWKNPGEAQARAKALYMVYFEPWDWIISATSYRSEFASLVRVQDFQERILSLHFGETGYPYVIDRAGTLIIHPALQGTNIFDSRDAAGRFFIRELCEKKNGKIIYPWQNPGEATPREKLVIFNDIPELGWIVASSSYLDEFYRPLASIQRLFLIAGGVTLSLILLLSLWLAATFSRPLKNLAERFVLGASGESTARMPEGSADEFGQLGRCFNSFMENLERSDEERRIAEGALRASEEKYRSIVNHAMEGIFQSTPGGLLLSANPAMVRLAGYDDAEEFIRECFPLQDKFYVEPADRDDFIRHLGTQDAVIEHEIRFLRKDGSRRWGLIKARAVRDEKGEVAFFEGLFDDITDRKETENVLRHARDMAEAANRMKSDFLSVMSHELRTPLTSIMGFIKIITRKLEQKVFPGHLENDPANAHVVEQIRQNLHIVTDEAGKLAAMIAMVLDFCEVENGRRPLRRDPIDPAVLIREAVQEIAPAAEAKGLTIVEDISSGLPTVAGDAERLRQVLDQLLINAVKFTEKGGITLRARQETVEWGDVVAISIIDTGVGIPSDQCEAVFEPFHQLGEVLTGKPCGTGLGLAVCRLMVQEHGGQITVASEPDSGSEFRVLLPVSVVPSS
jgi:PAS domain S-box-containing protein